jgi:hypothetical protein
MSHRRKEKDVKKSAAEALIDSGICFFKNGNCDKNYDCEHCERVPGRGKDSHSNNSRLLYISLKKARDIKKSANFKDSPTTTPPPPPPPPPPPESQKIH